MARQPRTGRSRRSVLHLAGGLASLGVAGAFAGCTNLLGSDEAPGRLSAVPAGSEYVLAVDVTALLADDSFHRALDAELAELDDGWEVRSLGDVLDRIVPGTTLDPTGLEAGIVFGDVTEASVGALGEASVGIGAVLWTDWEAGEVIEALETETGRSFDRRSHEDTPLYVPEGSLGALAAVGHLDDGVFVLGLRPAVEGAIDVHDGRADPVSGPVRDGFEAAGEGYLRVGAAIPRDRLASEVRGPIRPAVIDDLQHAFGSVYGDGDRRGIEVGLQVGTANSAGDLEDAFAGFRLLYADRLERSPAGPEAERLRTLLQEATVIREGNRVLIRYTGDPGAVAAGVRGLAFGPYGLSDPSSTRFFER